MEETESVVRKIEELLTKVGVDAAVEKGEHPEAASSYINIVTPDGRFLIGGRGGHLLALEYLVKRLLEKETGAPTPKFFLDVNGYRMHHIEILKDEAKQVAKKVRLYRKEMALKPMSSFERRVIHVALAEYPDITTESVGEGDRRRVVIKPYP